MSTTVYNVQGLSIELVWNPRTQSLNWDFQIDVEKNATFTIEQIRTIIDCLTKSLDTKVEIKG